jgi:hypothetical protein
VPYGDQVMLAQALQKTFPNVFFSSFFDIKYQHFKPKFLSYTGLISLGLIRPTERAYTISAAVAYLGLIT